VMSSRRAIARIAAPVVRLNRSIGFSFSDTFVGRFHGASLSIRQYRSGDREGKGREIRIARDRPIAKGCFRGAVRRGMVRQVGTQIPKQIPIG
jgi:hypothetical protein